MSSLQEAIEKGRFARKQFLSKDWLISWSHRSRFVTGLKLARELSAARVLDYGCGDGSFLTMLMGGANAPSLAVGAEVSRELTEDNRRRLAVPGLDFVMIEALDAPEHAGAYDLVACMEVLEHMLDLSSMLDKLTRLLAPGGRLLISVPVETGLPLVVKQAVRRIAGWRGIGDYPGTSSYTLRELMSSVFAGKDQHIARPVHTDADGRSFHDHKGFNWMMLRETLTHRFEVEKTHSSPVGWLPPHLASQVWFQLRKRS